MERKAEPITMRLPSEFTIECISYEYLQSVCKIKYFITCMKVAYIGTSVFVKMYQFWILSSFPPPFAYSYWVVFSLNIKVDWQSEQVFCELFAR